MSDIPDLKATIRKSMRERRQTLSDESRKEAGKRACKALMGHEIHLPLHAWRVCVYLSAHNEVPTRYVARALWEAGREVCVPVWNRSEKSYGLSLLTPRSKLAEGHFGIREPVERLPVFVWDVDAFVIPGLAFDARGSRLGFGGGYYDAILAKANRRALKIALCYDWQILEEPLPQQAHDMPVDWVVSEKRVIRCADHRPPAQTRSTQTERPAQDAPLA